jgi:ribonuclease VapC
MVIDTSAIVAVLLGEPERDSILNAIENSPTRMMSAVSVYETSIVMQMRLIDETAADKVQKLLRVLQVDIVPFDSIQAGLATGVYRIWGKSRHPAGLNMGDCVSYALADYHRVPLLFKGTDFKATPIRSVKIN